MKRCIIVLLLAGNLVAAAQPKISIADLLPAEGKWMGQLTYLDYTSNKQESIRATASVAIKRDNLLKLEIYYTDEPSRNGKDVYRIKENGTMINDQKVLERTLQADGTLKIVLESKGPDGNDHMPATFHHELVIGKTVFTITKLVRFDGKDQFFQRNQYAFSR
jgi:hypothetical protein